MPNRHDRAPGSRASATADDPPPMVIPTLPASRRTVLGWLAALLPTTTGFRHTLPWLRSLERLDDALLLALASAILPSEIGADGIRRAADSLQRWIAGYRPGAELNHGYGSARIRTSGADPSVRWALQLRSLDADARRVHGQGFAAASPEQRRALVRVQLAAERATSIPGDLAGAAHVALALLASFYRSPDATDLCYEAAIAPGACRPLQQVTQRPVPLRRSGGRA